MVAAVAMFAAAACVQDIENDVPETTGETVVYTAAVDGADTKAALNETTKKSEWVANDAITVHDGTKGWTFTTAAAGANVEFSNNEGFGEYRPVIAVYPAGEYTADVANKTVQAVIPTDQQAQVGTYHDVAALAVAYTENSSFSFKNAHALLKFTVDTDNVTHVIFHGNLEEPVTGVVSVKLGADGVETVTCEDKTYAKCYAWHDEDHRYFEKGETYYLAVAPQVFNSGITVKIQINEGEEKVVRTTDKKVTIKPNTILNLGELKYVAPETVSTVYLKPGIWDQAGAWFSAHFYNSIGGTADVKMTDSDSDGIYEAAVPSGMENVIFCRMNGVYTEFGWDVTEGEGEDFTVLEDHVWNQSGNEALPLAGDDEDCYVITGWSTALWQTIESALAQRGDVTIYVDDQTGWAALSVYLHGDVNDLGGGWPGVKSTETAVINGVTYKKFVIAEAERYSEKLIFSNNGANQLADYPITFTKTEYYLYVNSYGVVGVDPNNRADDPMYPGPQTIEIYCATDHTSLWAWLPDHGNHNLTGGTWPGMTAANVNTTINGVTYNKKWTITNVSSSYIGENLYVIFSGGSKGQTADSGPYTLKNKMYFTVDGTNKVTLK